MLRRLNSNQQSAKNQNTKPNSSTRKEAEAEEQINNSSRDNLINNILNTGNENAVKELLGTEKIQNNTDAEEAEGGLFDFFAEKADKQIIPEILKKAATNKKNQKDGGDNIINLPENDKEIISTSSQKKYGQKKPEDNIFPGEKPVRQEFYEDPADLQEAIEFLGEEPDLTKPNDIPEDLRVRSGRKIKNKKKNNAEENDLAEADADQKLVAGLNFSHHKLPKRNKAGGFRRFLTALAVAAGNTIGKGFNWIGSALYRLFSSDYRKRYRQGQSMDTHHPDLQQESRDHDTIPGWNGEKFQKGPDGQDNILADFRRIPTVWSVITAAQAEDSDGKPLPPKISVYVRQGEEAKDKTVSGFNPGHAGLGIEYSRYSRRTNRYERYNLRYGFAPAGGNVKAGALSMTSRAIIPGQLQDESFASFTIRRTFPATARQVNRILKASETYADKGYNTFTRNCTTFVRDMVRYEAGIPAGKEIFEREAPEFSSLINAGIFAGKSSEFSERASMEGRFKHLGSEEDLNYGGEGNKRATQQDYRQYKESLINSNGGYIGPSDLPNAAAENMRRLEGENAGTLSSKLYYGTAAVNPGRSGTSDSSGSNNNEKRPKLNADNIRKAINTEAEQLTNKILNVSGKRTIEEFLATPDLDEDLTTIVPQIQYYGSALYGVKDSDNTVKELRETRKFLDNQINDLNKLLKIFHNDERLHLPVLHLISLLEWGIELVDTAYDRIDFGKDAVGDVGYLRDKLDTRYSVTYSKPNPDPNSDKKKIRQSTEMSPSHFESYIQIYKSPEKAIEKYSRCLELSRKQNKTKAEEDEFKKLKRIERLAKQYDNAHNYMLEKDSYSQQDVDYAFSLSKKEKSKNIYGPLVSYSSSSIYKSLILEKIFGELTQRFENNFDMEDIKDEKMINEWLDKDMCTCINRRPNEMETVIKGLKKTMPDSTPEDVLIELLTVIQADWIDKVFDLGKFNRMKNKNENLMFKAKYKAQSAFKKIAKNSDLRTKLLEIIKRVFIDEEKKIQNA